MHRRHRGERRAINNFAVPVLGEVTPTLTETQLLCPELCPVCTVRNGRNGKLRDGTVRVCKAPERPGRTSNPRVAGSNPARRIWRRAAKGPLDDLNAARELGAAAAGANGGPVHELGRT
jgi:hypothetical protein